jgi:4-amino-4-deoxy-L-arabinose transferase-like glycosyltransferase
MFVSTYFFIFWARTSSSDMLNLAGIMVALLYYFKHRDSTKFKDYFFFFLIIAIASLFKGPVAAAIVFLTLIPEICPNSKWKKHINFSIFSALIISLLIYLTPFILSSHYNNSYYNESGLYLVFHENILRFFKPFDHKGPIYTYLIFLPIYTFPWILFFVPGLISLIKKWRGINNNTKWLIYANIIIFSFLTASGSRRSYYVIPMIPFVLMLAARWINLCHNEKLEKIVAYIALFFSALILSIYVLIMPINNIGGGATLFANDVKKAASSIQPWKNWSLTLTDKDINETYYLTPRQPITHIDRGSLNQYLNTNAPNVIYLLPSEDDLKTIPPETLKNYMVIIEKPTLYKKYLSQHHDLTVALVPGH